MRPGIAITKLKNMCVDPLTINIIQSFLSGYSQCVRCSLVGTCHHTSLHYISLPQGTILGPLFWNNYIYARTPATNYIKYAVADHSTVNRSIHKVNAAVINLTKLRSYVTLNADPLQEVTDYAFTWCESNNTPLDAKSYSLFKTDWRWTIDHRGLTCL